MRRKEAVTQFSAFVAGNCIHTKQCIFTLKKFFDDDDASAVVRSAGTIWTIT